MKAKDLKEGIEFVYRNRVCRVTGVWERREGPEGKDVRIQFAIVSPEQLVLDPETNIVLCEGEETENGFTEECEQGCKHCHECGNPEYTFHTRDCSYSELTNYFDKNRPLEPPW